MLINTFNKIAIRCSECGKYNIFDFNAFKLKTPTSLVCSCGQKISDISMNKNELSIDIKCIACEDVHKYKFKLNNVFKRRIRIISCPITNMEIAFLGKEEHIADIIEKYNDNTIELLESFGIVQSKSPRIG